MKFPVSCLFFVAAIVLSGFSPTAAGQSARVLVVDEHELFSTSEESFLRHNLATGALAITFIDGQRLTFELDPSPYSAPPGLAASLTVHPGGAYAGRDGVPGSQLLGGGPCSSQANALTAAIALVEAACSGDGAGTSPCHSAMDAYAEASIAYFQCMHQYYEQIK